MPLSVLHLESRDTPAELISGSLGLSLPINTTIAERFAVGGIGPGAQARMVRLQADGSLIADFSVLPYPGFNGEIRVASADVTNDLVADLITAAGPGDGPHVKVFDGRTGAEVRSFFAYAEAFRGGVNVAAADFNRDGFADIVTGAGAGGGPHVKVFDGRFQTELQSFYAYDSRFAGGVNVAAGDLTLDGVADIATGAGPGGGPHVKVFDGFFGTEIQSFFAFDATNTRGVNVALGDISGDNRADIVATLASPPPGARSVLATGGTSSPTAVVAFTQNPLVPSTFTRTLDAFASQFNGGVRVTQADVDGDGRSDAVFGTGPGDSRLRVAFGRDLFAGTLSGNPLLLGPISNTTGVFVG